MFALILVAITVQVYEANIPADHPEIGYWEKTPQDPVSRLAAELEAGTAALGYDDDGLGYLPAILDRLGVSTDTQVLVFSKTSLQRQAISPRTPRAIYFGDDVAVGYAPDGAAIEMAGTDPKQGVVLYTLANIKQAKPRFQRPKICIACHQAAATLGVPGVYVGSVLTTPSGRPKYRGSMVTDHRTRFDERWGGWYVSSSRLPHRGNAVVASPATDELTPLRGLTQPLDTDLYPTVGSDVVALMILEHQTLMTNLIIRLGWEARIGVEPSRLDARIDDVVRYMLFLDERPLPEPIGASSALAESFAERGPKDSKGRSLRELDLETRLFRYPLSYMIYSDAFDALPESVRSTIYRRLRHELQASKAILEILRDTKPDFRKPTRH